MNEARSPLAIRCTTAHNPTPMRNGWRVTCTMPSGGRATRPSSPTIVGFDVVNPVTARRKAGSMSMIATGFHHTGTPHHEPYDAGKGSDREHRTVGAFAKHRDCAIAPRGA